MGTDPRIAFGAYRIFDVDEDAGEVAALVDGVVE
ncbi:UNVERIFIED_CONTAM: hypothetical protein RKD50_009317 [Streptomyces canus]